MNFIKKIAEHKSDEWVKKQFTRYGHGTYEGKAVVQITKGSAYKINTSFEFAGELAYQLANTISGKTHVTGGMITTQKITNEAGFEFAGMKQFAGVKTYLIDIDLTKQQIHYVFEKFPTTLIFLSFKTDAGEIKTKVKNPKSTKHGNKETKEEPKADFCTFKTKDKSIIDDFTFDIKKDFTKLSIVHTFVIEDMSIPDQYKNDFIAARLHAIRKGKLIREISLDGEKSVKEYKLEA